MGRGRALVIHWQSLFHRCFATTDALLNLYCFMTNGIMDVNPYWEKVDFVITEKLQVLLYIHMHDECFRYFAISIYG